MRNYGYVVLIVGLLLSGCGGGGPIGGSVTAAGRVLDIGTGSALNRVSTVQTASATAQTSLVDGSFSVIGPRGLTSLAVIPPSVLGYPVFNYTVPALNLNQNDVGDLWIGPQQVSVTGTVRNAANGSGISGALVKFAGHTVTSNAIGAFTLTGVAYSNANTASFLGLVGRVDATNFFSNEFTSNGNTAVSGVVNVGDILMTPLDSDTPPPVPFSIWGQISPIASAPGTIVALFDSGNTEIRRFTVASDGRYSFWVAPGSYRLTFTNGTLTAPSQNVTLNSSTDVVRIDATLQ